MLQHIERVFERQGSPRGLALRLVAGHSLALALAVTHARPAA
jgi:hypothetical protein